MQDMSNNPSARRRSNHVFTSGRFRNGSWKFLVHILANVSMWQEGIVPAILFYFIRDVECCDNGGGCLVVSSKDEVALAKGNGRWREGVSKG
jgi:hypothetical protein